MINFGHKTEELEFKKHIGIPSLRNIIAKMGFGERAEITAFKHEEDDSD